MPGVEGLGAKTHTHDEEMPNTQRKGFKAKAGGGSASARSAATGKKMGRRAAASCGKNVTAADIYIDEVEEGSNTDTLFRIKTLARVVRPCGANRLIVTLQTGEEVETLIGGRVRFKGRAATKTDRPNCFVLNSIVLLDGGYAVSNLSNAHIVRIKEAYTAAGVPTFKGFFDGALGADCEGFDWDHSDAVAADAAAREVPEDDVAVDDI